MVTANVDDADSWQLFPVNVYSLLKMLLFLGHFFLGDSRLPKKCRKHFMCDALEDAFLDGCFRTLYHQFSLQFSIATMSSTINGLVNTENPDSDLSASRRMNGGPKMSDRRSAQRSSIPPSESNGALSDVEAFADDEVVGVRGTDRNRPRDPMARAVPRVVDKVGEKVAEEFENFLDQ